MSNTLRPSVMRNTKPLRVMTPVSVSVSVLCLQEKKKSMYGVYPHPRQEAPQANPWVGWGNHTTPTPFASLRASRLQDGGVL